VANPGGNRPLVRGALWLGTAIASGVAIRLADSRLRERKAPDLAAPAHLSSPLAPRTAAPAAPQPVRNWRAGIAVAGVLALALLGAAIAFALTRDEPTARPTAAAVAGTATARRTATPERAVTAPRTRPAPPERGVPTGGFVPARVFAWPAVRGADRYRIRFYRGSRLILEERAERPRFVVPDRLRLGPGRYRCLVLPHVRGSWTPAVVDSRFTVRRR
jgi:hypothetical protein